jgi:hypothetical protein
MSTLIPQDPSQADPTIVALMHGIKMQEGGGNINYNAIGDQGTAAGAGQWSNQPNGKPVPLAKGQIPSNFINAAKQYGLDPTDFSPGNQNKVLYAEIASGKQSGLSPEQILSAHNSGDPNAYSNPSRAIGTGSVGNYNVQTYVKQAMGYAQKYAQQNKSQPTSTTDASTDTTQQDQPMTTGGFLGNIASSAGNLVGGLGNAIMHPIKTIGALGDTAIGAGEAALNTAGVTNIDSPQTQAFGNLTNYFKNRYGGDNVGQIAQNIVHTAYTDPTGVALDLSTLLDGVGAAVGGVGKIADISKVADLSKAADLAKGADFVAGANGVDTGANVAADLTKQAATPGTISNIGSVIKTAGQYTNPLAPVTNLASGVADKMAQLSDNLPRRIINNLLPQLKTSALKDYAIDNLKVGSVDSMLKTSQEALDNYDSQINTILKHPDNAGIQVAGSDIANNVLSKFPNSEYTPESIFAKVKSQVPGSAKLVTRLENGTLSLDEANTLRKAADAASYKLTIDSPEVRAGKEVMSAFGNSLRSTIQDSAKETQPIFANYTKEINLKKALIKLAQKSEKKGAISMKELLAAMGVSGIGGPIAGMATLGAEKITDTPAARIAAAKVLKNVVAPTVKATAKGVTKIAPFAKEAAQAGKISNASQANQINQ